jgi:hypothetical protein
VGAPVTTVKHPDHAATSKQWVNSYLRGPSPQSGVGAILAKSGVALSKDRRTIRLNTRHQFFWDSAGRVRSTHARTHARTDVGTESLIDRLTRVSTSQCKWCITTLSRPTEDAHQLGSGASALLAGSPYVQQEQTTDQESTLDLELDALLRDLQE